jgi:hemoglobin
MERDVSTVTAAHDPMLVEAAIERLVRRFYEKGDADDLLGPPFRSIPALEDHLVVIIDFWSRQLIDTDRYQGRPFPPHWKLDIEPAHFDRWMALFSETAREELPADLAEKAITKAGHMATAFQAGMFPLRGPDGRPMRLPRD